jgi:hypothetical protein
MSGDLSQVATDLTHEVVDDDVDGSLSRRDRLRRVLPSMETVCQASVEFPGNTQEHS